MTLQQPSPRYINPEKREQLRDDGNFIGGLLIMFLILITFLMTAIAITLRLCGVLSSANLALPDLGVGNTVYLLFYSGVYTVILGIPCVLGVLLFKRSCHTLLPTPKPDFHGKGAVFLIGMAACMQGNLRASSVAAILEGIGFPPPENPQMLEPNMLSLALNLLALAVLPAILEELLFRGCIMGALRPYGDRFAILVSAVLFGIGHGGLTQSTFAFVAGLTLGWITVASGSIKLAMLIHFGNNAFSTLLEFIALYLPEKGQSILNAVSIYALLIIGFILLIRATRRRDPLMSPIGENTVHGGEAAKTLCKTPLMVIAVILLLLRVVQNTFL